MLQYTASAKAGSLYEALLHNTRIVFKSFKTSVGVIIRVPATLQEAGKIR